jgi:PAS domain S-box-containing protein
LKKKAELPIVCLFGLMLLLLAASSVASLRNISQSRMASDWVNHTHAVIFEAEGIASSINVAEKSLRDFVLTGSERDHTACRRGYAEAAEHISVGRALTRAEPAQNKDFLGLEALVAQRVEFARAVIKARREIGFEAARSTISRDNADTSEIERKVAALRAEEETLLRVRDKESFLQAQNTRLVVFAGIGINLAILAFMGYLVWDTIEAHRLGNAILEQSNRDLDGRVKEQTRELLLANQSLNEQVLEERWSNQALDHQLRYHQLIVNSVDTPVFVISRASNITRINPAVTRRTGFDATELIGQPLQRFVSVAEGPGGRASNPITSGMKEGRDRVDCPALLSEKSGRQTPTRLSVFPTRDNDKTVGAVVTLCFENTLGEK